MKMFEFFNEYPILACAAIAFGFLILGPIVAGD
jgi:hypothetical protein